MASASSAEAMSISSDVCQRSSDLVRRYFQQLTEGCGRQACPNRYCRTCVDGLGALDRTSAALRSLELAQGTVQHLCDELPPFLHIQFVQGLVAEAKRSSNYRPLIKEVSSVFSNADALNRSFLQSDAARHKSAAALSMEADEVHGLETEAVGEAYVELLKLQNHEVLKALMKATETLLSKLQVAQQAQPSFITDGVELRQFIILFLNPLLLEPQYHKEVLQKLLSLIAALPPPCTDRLASWMSLLPAHQLLYMVKVCHQFLTVRLVSTQRIDDAVMAATRVLGQLYAANEAATEAGWRTPQEKLDYRTFYNDAVNQEVNLKDDYRRWKSTRVEFSFCDHPFVLEPSSKSRVLMYDATAQMTHEFEGAILRSLFVGATSPYLVVKVRRSHLISDTLLQMGLRKDDLKKPLKVQFAGEDGVDEVSPTPPPRGRLHHVAQPSPHPGAPTHARHVAPTSPHPPHMLDPRRALRRHELPAPPPNPPISQGGVQKEFFQLIFAQIFDVSYGMFVYDEDARQYWFNRSSLENEREFELIGIILGAAIYNGVILDARFPHVVYKKLMSQPVGLADLQKCFPEMGKSFRQLLEMSAEQVEGCCLCMQVSYDEFGESKTFDLMPSGGEIAITIDNRDEYVRLYVKYLLADSIERQFAAFQRGFHSVCGGECLMLFRWEELELLICGSPVLDFEALERATQYDDGFSRQHPTVVIMWEVIHALEVEQQKKFLFFCTGSDRVPIKGLGNLNFVISRNGTDESRLPSAHTCFNHLLLPEYKSKTKLKEQLLKAIVDTEGFHII